MATDTNTNTNTDNTVQSLDRRAVDDLVGGALQWRLWGLMAWRDIRFRYRRSLLGPLWITLTSGVLILTLGLLYSQLFNQDVQEYFPFLAIGLLVWRLIADSLVEGCQTFIRAEHYIKNIRIPLSVHVLHLVAGQALTFLHNIIVYVVVAIVFKVNPGTQILLVPVGLAFIILNVIWAVIFLGTVSARFRDIPPVVQSVLQMAFFMTPIIWMPGLLKGRHLFIEWNPFFHFMEIVRAPLRGLPIENMTWYMVIGVTIVGWTMTYLVFRRWRASIPYWL